MQKKDIKKSFILIIAVLILAYGLITFHASNSIGQSAPSLIQTGGLSFDQGPNILTHSFGQTASLCDNPNATMQPTYNLFQDGANTLSLGNTTVSNNICDTNDDYVFRIYGDYISPTDWNAIQIKSDQGFANQFSMFTYSSSPSTTPRPLKFGVICSGGNALCTDSSGGTGGALSWAFNTSNNFGPLADNRFDIGRTQDRTVIQPGNGIGRPRYIYWASQAFGQVQSGCTAPTYSFDLRPDHGIDFIGGGLNDTVFCNGGDQAGLVTDYGFLVGKYNSGPNYTGVLLFSKQSSGKNIAPNMSGSTTTQCALQFVAGTNPGTGKLQVLCGTSNIPVTIADNIGSGF